MRKVLLALAITLSLPARSSKGSEEVDAAPVVDRSTRQLLLVRAVSWTSASGSLQRYERIDSADWRRVGNPIPVSLGRSGLAWGRGLQPAGQPGPGKREGDGRSPAGVFPLERAFGTADALPEQSKGFPYLHALPTTYCVEDTRSEHYNEIIDASGPKSPGWERWSPMQRADGLFRWGVIVRQNAPDVVVGAGSCVFLHIWRGQHQPTAGCTAMAPDSVEQLILWLDPEARPMLVQLPEQVYGAVREPWGLPDDDDSTR